MEMISAFTKNLKEDDGKELHLKALETDKDRKALYFFASEHNYCLPIINIASQKN